MDVPKSNNMHKPIGRKGLGMKIRCVQGKPGKRQTASCFALISAVYELLWYSLDLHTLGRLEKL